MNLTYNLTCEKRVITYSIILNDVLQQTLSQP